MAKFEDIEMAFDFVSSVPPFEHTAVIDVRTGETLLYSDFADNEDWPEEDLNKNPQYYIEIPHKNDLDLGRDLVFDFMRKELPDDFDTVYGYFQRRGAYRRFKDLLEKRDMLQQWYEFEESAQRKKLTEWVKEKGILLDAGGSLNASDLFTIRKTNLEAAVDGRAEEIIKRLKKHPEGIRKAATVTDCLENGYAPRGYGLADFTIVRMNGIFHAFHIPRVPGNACTHPANEHWIAHAVSEDLDTWLTRDPVLFNDPSNEYETSHVWAPFVHVKEHEAYMFYTGLSNEPSQVLCMAVSTDPDLSVWEKTDLNPITPLEGFGWHWRNEEGHTRHARDPHLVWVEDHWLLAYTAMHKNGCPAVGGLVSDDLKQWEDIGPIFYRPMDPAVWHPESVNIQQLENGKWVLIPSQSPGLEYYISDDPHHWHGIKRRQIEYADGDNRQPMALEVISKSSDGTWLTAFFERDNNRMFIGRLDINKDPWKLKRIREQGELTSLT